MSERRRRGWFVATVLLGSLLALPGRSQERPQQKATVAPYALIFGNVFDPAGRAFVGATVEIRREKERKPRWKTRSDARGEFAVRLPAGAARYVLTLRAKGYAEEVRTITVVNEERLDLVFNLQPASGGKR